MRQSDTVARIGGDEFSLVCEQIYAKEAAVRVAEKISQIFSKPFIIGDKKVHISASIGISLYPYDGNNVTRLLQTADEAMYCAKRDEKSNYRFFDYNCDEE
jgi:diguanylate cyclase (GGDEF)-like protein